MSTSSNNKKKKLFFFFINVAHFSNLLYICSNKHLYRKPNNKRYGEIHQPFHQLRTDVILADRDTGKQISNKLRFVYLSLPYFKKTAEECETNFEKWIYVLKHMEALDRMPFTATNKIFKELAQYAASHNLTAEEQEKYDESMKVVTDYYSGLVGSYMRGEKQGRADGMAEGMVKGMAKGMAEGLAKGRAETRKTQIETAARLRAMGLSDEQIAKATGLSQEEMQH